MTGNATEEYLLTKLDYPGHMDASRMAGLSGSATAIVSGLTAAEFLPGAAAFVIGAGAGLLAGSLIYRRLNARAEAKEAARRAARRAEAEAETERAIARMRAGGTG